MTWFEKLTGCQEESPDEVRTCLDVDGPRLRSRCNGGSWLIGELEMPTLAELRQRVSGLPQTPSAISVREIVADVQLLHADKTHENACFQVASQFNLLEMAAPEITPEEGVGIYECDRTQGPACAIAAGAGTIYRNYFVALNGRVGQSVDNQIDCLAQVGVILGNSGDRLWRMINGYAYSSFEGLNEIDQKLRVMNSSSLDQLRQALQVGLLWDTQVTIAGASHVVTQIYCSALPVAYSNLPSKNWARFASLVLEAAYEATICAAIINAHRTGKNNLFLTLLGGGAFGNEQEWIMNAIRYALARYADCGLDVAIVSHGRSKPCVQQVVAEFSGK